MTGLGNKPVILVLMKNRVIFLGLITVLILVLLCACSFKKEKKLDNRVDITEIPTYIRKTTELSLKENANIYMMDFGTEGFFYYVMDELTDVYQFYYQKFDGTASIPFCEIKDGYIRGFSQRQIENQIQLCLLQGGVDVKILIYDESGKMIQELLLDSQFDNLGEKLEFLALPNGSYAIAIGDKISILDRDGKILREIVVENTIVSLLLDEENELYATTWEKDKRLIKIDMKNGNIEKIENLSQGTMEILPYIEGFAYVFSDHVEIYNPKLMQTTMLVDLNKQSILAGQIKSIYREDEQIVLLSIDPEDEKNVIKITLSEKEEESAQSDEKNIFTSDGRRIIYVAVPEEYDVSVEFHAKKYNQKSDKYFIQVVRFQGPLADYLGKGNRPDIVLFKNHTEIKRYVDKNMLEDLIPLFSQQERYSLDEVIPKVRETLGADCPGCMYAIAGRFNLLIHSSNGNENDENGNCDTINYLKWFDQYLVDNDIEGMNDISWFVYAVLPKFYEEKSGQAFFESEEFEKLMIEYKEVVNNHKGELKPGRVYNQKGGTVQGIALGPEWRKNYVCWDFLDPTVKKKGIPGIHGEELIYISIDYPMSIMKGCECKEGAFDFIMYFSSSNELAKLGDESGYGLLINTSAEFSSFKSVLDELIFETEVSFGYTYEPKMDGTPDKNKPIEIFFTEDNLNQLHYLIDNAIPTTRAQEDIYIMVMEEMEPYLKDQKDLNSCCRVLQSRVELYLSEGN